MMSTFLHQRRFDANRELFARTIGLLALVGLTAAAASCGSNNSTTDGTLPNADGGGTGGSGGTDAGEPPVDSGSGGTESGGSGGAEVDAKPECAAPGDCPATENPCIVRTCLNQVCGQSPVPAGTLLAEQPKGTCTALRCDGEGGTVPIIDDANKPRDEGPCRIGGCDRGEPTFTNTARGTDCGDGV